MKILLETPKIPVTKVVPSNLKNPMFSQETKVFTLTGCCEAVEFVADVEVGLAMSSVDDGAEIGGADEVVGIIALEFVVVVVVVVAVVDEDDDIA